MNLNDLRAQSNMLDEETGKAVKHMLQLISIGNKPLDQYAEHLEKASTWHELAEAIYADDALRCELVWSEVALFLHPNDCLTRFEPVECFKADAPNNVLQLNAAKGDRSWHIGLDSDVADVRVFKDGAINEQVFRNIESFNVDVVCNGHTITAPFSVHTSGNIVSIVPWELGPDGFRVSQKTHYCVA